MNTLFILGGHQMVSKREGSVQVPVQTGLMEARFIFTAVIIASASVPYSIIIIVRSGSSALVIAPVSK